MSGVPELEVEREFRRFFRRFTEAESFAAPVGESEIGLFVARNSWRRPVLRTSARLWAAFERRDFLYAEMGARGSPVWRPSEAGLSYYRRLEANDDPFRAQHQLRARRKISSDGGVVDADVNDAETTLGWLRQRRKSNGEPLVSESQFEAGERLRRDFTLARMNPRVTMDWSLALGPDGGGRIPRDPSDITDRAIAARRRVTQALDTVGPGLADILVEVCCNLRGLEDSERGLGWPQRSGKVVLQIALDRLAVHYGISERSAG